MIADENTEVNQLRTHDLDWQFEASPDLYNVLKTVPDTRLVPAGSQRVRTLRSQYDASRRSTDVHVRQAISYAIDRKKLVDTLDRRVRRRAGRSRLATISCGRTAPTITAYPPDPAKARALSSRRAGWTAGPDGMVAKGGKKPRTHDGYQLDQYDASQRRRSNSIDAARDRHHRRT